MRFRTTTLLLVLLLTTARTTPARPVSKDTSRAAAFRAGCPKADGANLAVELRGGELRIRFAESEGRNLRYTFRRCMFNELFTFYEVAVEERNTETVLNRATSDNLGPLGIDGYGWAGANHSWREGGTVRTARHVGVSIEADGRCIGGDTSLRAREVTIRVENRIFDPRMPVADSAGRAELQTPLCTERVCYRVRENNIEVAVSHEFHNSVPATIRTYYGMQSMFCDETHTLTPDGAYADWTPQAAVSHFTKGDYPAFRRFVEKNDRAYQSSWLLPKVRATTPGSTIRTRYSSATPTARATTGFWPGSRCTRGTGCTGAASTPGSPPRSPTTGSCCATKRSRESNGCWRSTANDAATAP